MFFNFLGFLIFYNFIVLGHSLYSVAFECGKPAIYLNNEFWVTDLTQDCLEDELSILNYCKKVYSERNITAVVSAPPIDVVLSDWCEFAHKKLAKCQSISDKRHEIKPFICLDNIPMTTLFTPVGCQLSSLDNERSYVCENYKFWESSTREACLIRNMRFQSYLPYKPCISEKDFRSMYFAAAKVVCCKNLDSDFTNSAAVMKPLTDPGNKISSMSHKPSRLGNKLTTTENGIWDSDKTVINYLSFAKQNSSSGLLIPERERYSQAKLALGDDLRKREKVLEQKFSSEESLISPEDWLNEPVKSQLEEDSLVQEFLSKFIKLENQSERDRKTLETIHHQRIEAQMLERRNAMQNTWEKAVNIENPNNFTLFETLKRLFRVVEHDRSHYIKRFEHLRNMELPEAAQQLASIKEKLVELDILLNKSLEKINLHPELSPPLLTYANYLRNNEYRDLESQSKAVLVADVTLPDMIKLPTFQEQVSLKAEKILAKHRHHLEPLYSDKLTTNKSNKSRIKPPRRHKMLTDHPFGGNKNKNFSNSHQMKTTIIIPTVSNLVDIDVKSFLSTVDYSSSLSLNQNQHKPHINSSEMTENKTNVQFGSYQNISVVMLHSDQLLNTSNSSTINLSTQIHVHKTTYILLILLEVDEVIAPKVNSPQFLPVKQSRLRNISKSITNHHRHHHNDSIHYWQLNGYENPAYKITSNTTDKFNNTNRYHHLGLFHQDNSFDDFEI
ncbi:unnamed protein product [Schistosoma rodhaini]|uniref:Uncharacterized protein n=1 Tax=Schistosoma rodhaini TaxID=6188 RepID=A0AA85EUW3_9TREM|nr:unnamed protein product [Schistosoma rodhaini]